MCVGHGSRLLRNISVRPQVTATTVWSFGRAPLVIRDPYLRASICCRSWRKARHRGSQFVSGHAPRQQCLGEFATNSD